MTPTRSAAAFCSRSVTRTMAECQTSLSNSWFSSSSCCIPQLMRIHNKPSEVVDDDQVVDQAHSHHSARPLVGRSLSSKIKPRQRNVRPNVCEVCARTLVQLQGGVSPTCCLTFISRVVCDCVAFSNFRGPMPCSASERQKLPKRITPEMHMQHLSLYCNLHTRTS